MKQLFILFAFILFCILPFSVIAQESKGVSETITGYPRSPIKLSADEYVFVSGKYGEGGDMTLVKFNSNLQVLWKKSLPDGLISVVKMDDNFLVFSSREWAKNTYSNIKTIHVTLIDSKSSNTILDKDLLTIDDKFFADPYILQDSLRNFKGLILRYSNLEHIKLFNQEKSFAQMKETQKIDWLSFDDKMNVKSTVTLNNNFSGARVMTIISNKQGDIFITSVQQNKLVTDKYAAGKADKAASLSINFPKLN